MTNETQKGALALLEQAAQLCESLRKERPGEYLEVADGHFDMGCEACADAIRALKRRLEGE